MLSRFSDLYLPLRFSNLPEALWERRSVARRPKITHPLFSSPQPSVNSAGQSAQTACHRLPWTVSALPVAAALLAVLQWLEIPQTKLSVLSKKVYLAVEFSKIMWQLFANFNELSFNLKVIVEFRLIHELCKQSDVILFHSRNVICLFALKTKRKKIENTINCFRHFLTFGNMR